MGKRTKAKDHTAAADMKQQVTATVEAEAPRVQPEPSRKRTKTLSEQSKQQHGRQHNEQQQQQQQTNSKPVKASAKRTVARKRSKQQQDQEQQEQEEQQQQSEEPAAAAEAPQSKKGRASKSAAAADKPAAEKPPYYLVKSEPHVFSIDDLESRPNQTEPWDGVRNAQARNIMRGMAVGDLGFFYHSSCKVPGIVGIAQVVREAYPDPTAFDTKSEYYDASSSEDKPKWYMVDWKLVRKLKRQITLEELKSHKDGALAGMALFNRPRLSVQPVTNEQWEFVLSLENEEQQQD